MDHSASATPWRPKKQKRRRKRILSKILSCLLSGLGLGNGSKAKTTFYCFSYQLKCNNFWKRILPFAIPLHFQWTRFQRMFLFVVHLSFWPNQTDWCSQRHCHRFWTAEFAKLNLNEYNSSNAVCFPALCKLCKEIRNFFLFQSRIFEAVWMRFGEETNSISFRFLRRKIYRCLRS